MKHPEFPPVDEEIIEAITPEGRRVPVAIRRDIQEINPATGERRWIRTTSLLPSANGTPFPPEQPRVGVCQVCGLGPLNLEDLRRCHECERAFCITQCLGMHAPGPDDARLYLCTECERRLRRQELIRYFCSLG
jgi:hypothetical protein